MDKATINLIMDSPLGLIVEYFGTALIVAALVNGLFYWIRSKKMIMTYPERATGYKKLFWWHTIAGAIPFLLMGAGILSGHAKSPIDYLMPGPENQFVTLWYVVFACFFCLYAGWIYLLDGAEMLEQHPGFLPFPPLSVKKLKLAWLGIFIWNFAFGALLYFGLPWSAEPDPVRISIQNRINVIGERGKTLPPCPLVFPLLDGKGKVNSLGSYLSYVAMKKASYIPNSILSIPNAGQMFNQYHLFKPEAGDPGRYKEQLPYSFNTENVVGGQLVKNRSGHKITLNFSGPNLKPGTYSSQFNTGSLHQAPAWMASRIHEWMGLDLDSDQSNYVNDTMFDFDADLQRAASVEWAFRSAPELVTGWEGILERNGNNPLLIDRWLAINDRRAWASYLGEAEKYLETEPRSTTLKISVVSRQITHGQYSNALNIIWPELRRDELNPEWYTRALTCLRSMGYWEEAKDLLITLHTKHPKNTGICLSLASLLRDYAWVARGTSYAKDVSKKAGKLFANRIEEGLEYALLASELSPKRVKTWNVLLWYGISRGWNLRQQEDYFQKVLELDPNYSWAYFNYVEYLQPKWYGEPGQSLRFAEKYGDQFPLLLTRAYLAEMRVFLDKRGGERTSDFKLRLRQVVRSSPFQEKYVEAFKRYLENNPTDLSNWMDFNNWLNVMDKRSEVLPFAEQVCQGSKEMQLLYPYIRLALLVGERSELDNDVQRKAFDENPVKLLVKANAYERISELDPLNWTSWNRQAMIWTRLGRRVKARKAFGHMAGHWDKSVWSKAIFNKTKAEVMGAVN